MDKQLSPIPCGLLTLTIEGIALSINRTLLELLGYSEKQVIGQHINVLLSTSAKAFTQLYFFPMIIVQQRIDEMYLTLEKASGEEIPVLMNASISDETDEQTITCVILPMKHRNEYENQLLIAKKEAEDALSEVSKAKSQLEQTLKTLEKNKEKLLEVNRQNESFKLGIQNELKLAKKIQAKSLPLVISNDRIEIESYYLASGDLSGDIYGCYKINDYQYGIIILDVMGHGISAALITMSLQSLFQMLITKGTATDVVMRELDNHLHTLFKSNSALWHYCTGICLVMDTNKQTIKCINAGHPPAIFQDSTGDQIELCSTSPPLGTFEGMEFKTDTLHYDKGSRVLLYTDGVSEPLDNLELNTLLRQHSSDSIVHCKEQILQAIQMKGEENLKSDDQCYILVDLK